MINSSKVLAIIPARKGSVGLKKKNIKSIYGEPLISWTIKQCQYSKYIDKTVVSTDCKQIINIASKHGIKPTYIRPKYLSKNSTSTFEVVRHMINFLNKKYSERYEYIVLAQPTSPLRDRKDFDNLIFKLEKNKKSYDSIVSVGKCRENPSLIKKISGQSILPFNRNIDINVRRQLFKNLYYPNGLGFVVKANSLLKEKTFYTKRQTFYLCKQYQNYDIDDIYDFLNTETIMKLKNYNFKNYNK
tara:strand:+ start:507 stop:1238 length:732 start_codon:yes stop_codon:yes gene_type:complete